jgi:hypothetical protein
MIFFMTTLFGFSVESQKKKSSLATDIRINSELNYIRKKDES